MAASTSVPAGEAGSVCGDERGRLEQLEAVGGAGQRVDRVLGCGISPTTLPAWLLTPAMSRAEPLKPLPARSGARPGRSPRARRAPGRAPSSGRSGAWPGSTARSPGSQAAVHLVRALTTSSATWRQSKRSDVFGSSAPGSSPASHSTWKPLQMPSTSPPWRGEALDLGHDRREARERARAQVVAVGEAAGDDHRVDALQVVVAVPEQHRVADPRGRRAARRRSSHEPGNWMTPNFIEARPADRSRSPRRAGWRAAARTSPAAAPGPRRRARPAARCARCARRRSRAPAAPARPPGPAGRGSPPSGRIRTRALTRHALQPGRERLAGELLVGGHVALARGGDDVVGDRRRRRRLVPAGAGRPVAHVLLVERRLAAPDLVLVGGPEARGVRRADLVAQRQRRRRRRSPNSNFVSARITPRSRACAATAS